MKKYLFASICFVLFLAQAPAQKRTVSGLWSGALTTGGLESTTGYRLELWLEQKGKHIRGKSYLHLGKGEIVEKSLKGTMYHDRSMYINEFEFIGKEGQAPPPYFRTYQIIHNNGIWDTNLQGYWQEITPQVFSKKRQLGKLLLKKADGSKA